MPFKLGESSYPGTVEEKLRAEVGAYAWLQENCPDIRIPQLYGFRIADHHFTHEARLSWYARIPRIIWRLCRSIFQGPFLSRYVPNPISTQLPVQYMLLEYIDADIGRTLSSTWLTHREDPIHRGQLFRGIARIIVSLSRIPQPRIGSFQFHDDCTVTLTNRPTLAATTIMENFGAKRSMHPGDTYSCTESFVTDMITLHDNYFYNNKSAADDAADCRGQMAIRTLLRAISHHYIKREYRNGPFVLQLTDLHQSNIFVDDDWNVTCLLDLEWLCALPAEALSAPYWLSGRNIAHITNDEECHSLTEYNDIRQEFMQALAEEESRCQLAWPLTRIVEDMWQSGGTWFWFCLSSIDAAYYLIDDHLCPRFSAHLSIKVEEAFSHFWKEGAEQVVAKKLSDYKQYEQDLSRLFPPHSATS